MDRYLDHFAHLHPSIAAGNGLHGHDGELEDFSSASISAEIKWLHAARGRFAALDPATLTLDERVDREILSGIIDGWLLDLDTVRTWQRNPMIYVAAISDGMHDLVTMESAPAAERMRSATTKLRAVPGLLAAARTNLHNPPRVFVERAVEMLDGVSDLLTHDLPLAFPPGTDAALRKELMLQAAATNRALLAYRDELKTRSLAQANGSYAVGVANVEARYRAEELIDLPATQLLAIGERELERQQAQFRETAARIDPRQDAALVWRSVQDHHPQPGQLVPAAATVVTELFAFIDAHG
ncbi:MAG TPA: DUF885 family protein, partial [Steroidobacteraceae bacterium]